MVQKGSGSIFSSKMVAKRNYKEIKLFINLSRVEAKSPKALASRNWKRQLRGLAAQWIDARVKRNSH